MFKPLTACILALFAATLCYANDYDDAWAAIRKKDFKTAETLLTQATKNPSTALDAYLTLDFLHTYRNGEDEIKGLTDKIAESPDKSAYLYALWFNGSIVGQYGKKKEYQMDLINKIINDPSYNGTMQAAAHYVKSLHYIHSNDMNKTRQEWSAVGSVMDWQLTGPFENLSGSGFINQYGPLGNPAADASFKGLNNISVSWFAPSHLDKEGWIFTYPHIAKSSAVIFAQSFVYVPGDQNLMLNVGGNGAVRVWVNDGLVLSESNERVTELDYYKNQCTLKKGYNRVLVQLAYTDNSLPNFIVRFTDANGRPVPGLTATTQVQPYTKTADAAHTSSLKHFAEDVFEKKIAADSSNLVNYLLLCQTYLRDRRTTEARQLVEKALRRSPENPLLKFELIQCLLKSGNRTLMLQEVDWLKENDPDNFVNYQIKIQNLINEEKYTEALDELDKMTALYPEDENSLNTRITILAKLNKMDELLNLVDRAYNKYPDNETFLSMMYRVKKLVRKDAKGAMTMYEKFLRNNYNHTILNELASEYKDQGMNDKYLDLLKKQYDDHPYDPKIVNSLSKYYYEKRDYAHSLQYANEALLLAPYNGTYWENVGDIQDAMSKHDDAIASYKKTIYYDRTNYDARKKLNTLLQKPDLYKQLPETDVYALIKKTPVNKDYDYNYLLDEKGVIIYDEGASEEYITYAVKLNTQKGIDAWKELYLSYNENSQTIIVEKNEVVKANGSKVTAERNDDHVVFTGLEPGDAIYVRYRVQNYASGRMGREFVDKFIFNSFAPSATARYTLIAPKNYQFSSKVINSNMQPVVKDIEDFKIYTWEQKDLPALKSEPLMPPLNDVGAVLHISSLKNWSDVAGWYSDVSYQDLSENYELTALYNEIFAGTKGLNNFQKARLIYNYIVTNIRYSSVSFRQSGLVPQEVSKIISTRLGDCKDLSTLFVALATKAGIPAQLVLIDTRDNGGLDMILPSTEFNHCIAMANLDGKEYYIELTDGNLPFTSIPGNLQGALSLVIPPHGQKASSELKPLAPANRTTDRSVRVVNVVVTGKDEKITVQSKKFGSLSSSWREDYATLTPEKQKEEYEQAISNGNKNSIKLESVVFTGLDELKDSVGNNYTYTVKNEVVEAGSMNMIRVPFIDIVATLENFSADKRDFPVEYWDYENTDVYETVVNIQLPAGKKIIELPADQHYSFKGCQYSIRFVKTPDGGVKVYRTAKLQRDNIVPADYEQFKKFFNDIVETESKYIVFK